LQNNLVHNQLQTPDTTFIREWYVSKTFFSPNIFFEFVTMCCWLLVLFVFAFGYVCLHPRKEHFGIGVPTANDFSSGAVDQSVGSILPPSAASGYDPGVGLTW